MKQVRIGSVKDIVTTWECDNPECQQFGESVQVFLTDWPDIGTPQCSECDCENDLTLCEPVYSQNSPKMYGYGVVFSAFLAGAIICFAVCYAVIKWCPLQ